ncbi:kynurenine formamidase [Evansella vedderi]|uniref:Kynurenine formamidase n=1 Tax=Evansella vedderi TaxID=38282 RepID=A0ABT9ZVW5_9BACI|nr:kynurenine formamidase [Evansella vedderi]
MTILERLLALEPINTINFFYVRKLSILENVVLDSLSIGDYELIALPLAIKEGDGSPVRAVVRPL